MSERRIDLILPGLGVGSGRSLNRFRIMSGAATEAQHNARKALVLDLYRRGYIELLRARAQGRIETANLIEWNEAGDHVLEARCQALSEATSGRTLDALKKEFIAQYTRATKEKIHAQLTRFIEYVAERRKLERAEEERATRTKAMNQSPFADTPILADLNATNINLFLQQLRRDTKRKEEKIEIPKVSAATKNRYRAALQLFAAWLVRNEYMVKNPTADKAVPKHKEFTRRLPSMTSEQFTRYVAHARKADGEGALLLLVLLLSGADVGEVMLMQAQDLTQGTVTRIRFQRTKTATKERLVPIPESVAAELAVYMAKMKILETDRVFPPEFRKRAYTAHRFARRVIGKPELRIKDLRHLAALIWLKAGVNIVTISGYLGHSTLGQTMRYVDAHPNEEEAAKVALDVSRNLGL